MLKKTLLSQALSLAFSAAALTVAFQGAAHAQSNASGNIVGRIEQPAGATVTMTNTDTGLKRSVTPDANGRYQATALPPGHYKVELVRDGKTVTSSEVDVVVGQGVEADLNTAVATVQVVSRRSKIDVTNATNGVTFSARQLAQLPIAQNMEAIIQLAPNTTRADSRYAAGASIGGGGASENAYYINGFPVTNPLNQLGGSELPFGAIAQFDINSGGFGAEFGRSVGGVVNITTKSGTNAWEAGAMYSIEPNSLRSKKKDSYYQMTGKPENASTDGKLYWKHALDTETKTQMGAYVGGPLIKDTLFMFVAAEQTNRKRGYTNLSSESVSAPLTGWRDRKDETERYVAKFDWNINDNHRLEFTSIGDTPKSDYSISGYDYATNTRNGVAQARVHQENQVNGGITNMLRYVGNITPDLTLTAVYGKSKADIVYEQSGGDVTGLDPNKPGVVVDANARAAGLTYSNPNPFANVRLPGTTGVDNQVMSKRLDLEYRLGSHTIRAGLDNNHLTSNNAGEATAGGYTWRYRFTSNPAGLKTTNPDGSPGLTVAQGGGLGTQGYYVTKSIFNDLTTALSNQSAQYLEDKWQVNKNWLVTAGLRVEQYKNINGDGNVFMKMDNQINPRLNAIWDVNGDASLKVYGSAGRYSIQIPTHVAVRGAGRSTTTTQYFTYTGVDANGAPTGLTKLNDPLSSNNEYGQAKLYQTVAAQNLKPSYQDEITLGFDKMVTPDLNAGARFTYRKLRQTIDDYCDQRPFDTWAERNNVDASEWGGFGCASINPGETNEFLVNYNADGKTFTKVTLTAADMGFTKPTRTYTAFDAYLEHPYRNGWYGRVNYTWSRSKGNTEGQTLSTIGQTDVAATQTWDFPEIMLNADGLLPNDRTHQIKAYGFYDVTPEWQVSGNFLASSGQPLTCLGAVPQALIDADESGWLGALGSFSSGYGSGFHFCNGKPSAPGSAGRLPWDIRLDLGVAYKPALLKGLAVKMDVFNVLNKQTVTQVDTQYNSSLTDVSPTYLTPGAGGGDGFGRTAPRSVRLSVEYNHKF